METVLIVSLFQPEAMTVDSKHFLVTLYMIQRERKSSWGITDETSPRSPQYPDGFLLCFTFLSLSPPPQPPQKSNTTKLGSQKGKIEKLIFACVHKPLPQPAKQQKLNPNKKKKNTNKQLPSTISLSKVDTIHMLIPKAGKT